jgi:hypothetical protein
LKRLLQVRALRARLHASHAAAAEREAAFEKMEAALRQAVHFKRKPN